MQPGEVNYFGAAGTVWYSFTPTENAPVAFSLGNAPVTNSVIVQSAPAGTVPSVGGLQAVTNNGGSAPAVQFFAQAGQTYYIQVGSTAEALGAFSIASVPPDPAIDVTPPAAPAIVAVTDADGDAVTTTGVAGALTFSGTAEPGSIVVLKGNLDGVDADLGSVEAGAEGNWSITVENLVAGVYSFGAVARDDAGNQSLTSSNLLAITLEAGPEPDTTPPEPPVILAAANSEGPIGDGVSTQPVLIITGTAEPLSTITLFNGEETLATGIATNAEGNWSFTTAALSEGSYSFTAVATDAAGNPSTTSPTPLVVEVDLPDGTPTPTPIPTEALGFDAEYYLAMNPDVAAAGVDPLAHYTEFGWQEGRDPNALFDISYYLNQNPDVAAAQIDPLAHYIEFGWVEGRDPSYIFSGDLYLENNVDVAEAGVNPLVHYLYFGSTEGRDTFQATPEATGPQAPLVDAQFYFQNNPDVAKEGVDPSRHFAEFGWQEGRDPNAFFDIEYYLANNVDVAEAGINPVQHYLEYGAGEGRDPSAAFSTEDYLAANVDVAEAGVNPLQHYLEFGIAEGRPLAPVVEPVPDLV
ncbi:hypothetical protein CR162_19315 [Pseudoroseomonas rhizosphaerae]|uniref:Bacterial Ig-like domain-containing protein n=1 Tax=Teichococcus rhizosphaerae TaxID=1335062 RepID=A0A2C7A4M6_9PROT|nr:hypothetical protein CR162_19315 [Pseudoroseomonas rhizosphaerae]